jgi:hypothetical protein
MYGEAPGGTGGSSGPPASYDFSSMVTKHAIVGAQPPSRKRSYPSKPPGTVELHYEEPPMKVSWIPDDVPVTRENLLKALEVTEAEREFIWSVEQRDPEWHRARLGRLTGSKAGAAAGFNSYESPKSLLNKWLYVPVVDNFNMKWGRDHEEEALQAYRKIRIAQFEANQGGAIPFDTPPSFLPERYRRPEAWDNLEPVRLTAKNAPFTVDVVTRGLIVNAKHPWMGYSPDGEVTICGGADRCLLEIKCPQKLYDEFPDSYYCQVLFGMFNLGLKSADCFIWRPDGYKLWRFAFNRLWWEEVLYPALERFYFDQFIPAAIVAIEKQRAFNGTKYTKRIHI